MKHIRVSLRETSVEHWGVHGNTHPQRAVERGLRRSPTNQTTNITRQKTEKYCVPGILIVVWSVSLRGKKKQKVPRESRLHSLAPTNGIAPIFPRCSFLKVAAACCCCSYQTRTAVFVCGCTALFKNYHGGPLLIGPMVHIKTYIFNHFF